MRQTGPWKQWCDECAAFFDVHGIEAPLPPEDHDWDPVWGDRENWPGVKIGSQPGGTPS